MQSGDRLISVNGIRIKNKEGGKLINLDNLWKKFTLPFFCLFSSPTNRFTHKETKKIIQVKSYFLYYHVCQLNVQMGPIFIVSFLRGRP